MSAQKDCVYIFKDNTLLIPEEVPDSEAIYGVEEERIPAQWKNYGYVAIPTLETSGVLGDGPGNPGIRCCALGDDEPLPQGWRAIPVRAALTRTAVLSAVPLGFSAESAGGEPDGDYRFLVNRLFRAFHLLQWRRNSAYCGSCGTPNEDSPSETARVCPACGRLEYPRISPAVIVVITNDQDQILLAHNKRFSGKVYSLIAGFNEAGENLEATVIREIHEEVGIGVRDIQYITSQPWPFPNSLMIGFSAHHASGEISPDGSEISDACWFNRDNLPDLPGPGSIARYLINIWVEGKIG